jgi:hypothetical protein
VATTGLRANKGTWSARRGFQELDELVYALYGLTPEEIKIVEGAK